MKRKTIRNSITTNGLGIFSGKKTQVKISPGDEGLILRFGGKSTRIGDNWKYSGRCSSVMVNDTDIKLTEHFLAAARIWGLTDALIEINFPEFPILDGCGLEWFEMLEKGKANFLNTKVETFTPTTTLIYAKDDIFLCWKPSKELKVTILYHHLDSRIPVYYETFDLGDKNDKKTILSSKTFVFEEEIENLLEKKIINHESKKAINSVEIIGKSKPGLFIPAHKCLDLIGDMYLSGKFFSGEFLSVRGGHASNQKLLEKAFKK